MPTNGVKHSVTKSLKVKLSVNFFHFGVIKPKGYEFKIAVNFRLRILT